MQMCCYAGAQEYKTGKEGLDLVFYGDSITESLRGTQMGTRIEKFYGIPEVAKKHYGHLRTAAFSIAGAHDQNVLAQKLTYCAVFLAKSYIETSCHHMHCPFASSVTALL